MIEPYCPNLLVSGGVPGISGADSKGGDPVTETDSALRSRTHFSTILNRHDVRTLTWTEEK